MTRSQGAPLDTDGVTACPARTDAVPSPDDTVVQSATDGGLPMPVVDVDVPVTEGHPCVVRRGT